MKKVTTLLLMMLSVFLMPVMVFAADDENPIKKIGGYMKWNWTILDGLDWLFSPVMIVFTGLLIVAFVTLLWRIINKGYKIIKGKEKLKDKEFWIEAAVMVLFLFLLFSGALFKILGNIYDWTNKQDIGGTETAIILQIDADQVRYHDTLFRKG
ncbi:putative membrane protein [Fontibacillus solani]|uniref:Putative membrane protein n=1 Tax=Fontibacillus solani TaxID=1572857 RepID=A0A7W3XSG7_9BACL|nr:hypothetical protein [Fontibacillus solani]MBA9086510.1 putative membrane protein [Fontibacillus solani]